MTAKSRKAALACLMACVFALTGCGTGGGGGAPAASAPPEITVWSASSADKILRDYEYPDEQKGAAAVDVSLAKNEREGAQLILNTDRDVPSFDVTVSGFVREGETAADETVTVDVYQQMYVETKFSSEDYFYRVMNISVGWFPDAILPFETAAAYRENRLYEGRNQGLWLTFSTTADTKAGTYAGTVEIKAGGSTLTVPVTLEVWDFTLPDESHGRTLFNIYRDAFTDSIGDGSDEMYEKYYEFFLDYRVNLQKLPVKTDDFGTFIAAVKKYHFDERVNTWALPTFNEQENPAPSGSVPADNVSPRTEKQMELVAALAVESVKDGVNYLEKAVHYPIEHDEFQLDGADGIEYAKKGFAQFRQYTMELTDQLDAVYGPAFLDSVPGLRDSVRWLPELSVANYMSTTYETFRYANLWVPVIHNVASQVDVVKNDLFDDDGAEYGEIQQNKELWTYTCNFPKWPYPTHHIDDALFTSRLLWWMMYDYGFTGNLYWLAVMTGDSQSEDSGAYNPWENAESNASANGDGNFAYPGTYYGIDGPVATIRLESIRDGAEEYEYFYLLDSLYKDMQAYYGADSLSYRNVCNEIFASLYNEGRFTGDISGAQVIDARERVAEAIQTVNAPEHLIVETDYRDGGKHYVSVLLSAETQVEENEYFVAKEPANQGFRYRYEFDVTGDERVELQLRYTVGGEAKTFTKLIKSATRLVTAMDSESDLAKVNVSAGSTKSLGSYEGTACLKLDIAPVSGDAWFNILMSQLNAPGSRLQLTIYNGGSETITAELVYKLTQSDSAPIATELAPGRNVIDVDLSSYGADEVAALAFMLDGSEGYTIYLSEVKYYED